MELSRAEHLKTVIESPVLLLGKRHTFRCIANLHFGLNGEANFSS